MNDAGEPAGDFETSASEEMLVRLYRWMLLTRAVDERGDILVRQGRTGSTRRMRGKKRRNWFGGLSRAERLPGVSRASRLGVVLMRGMTPANVLLRFLARAGSREGTQSRRPFRERRGTRRSAEFDRRQSMRGGLGRRAVAQLQGKDVAVITYFGDGATSEGDLLATLNMAGVYRAPIVFACKQPLRDFRLARAQQTASATFADKARKLSASRGTSWTGTTSSLPPKSRAFVSNGPGTAAARASSST